MKSWKHLKDKLADSGQSIFAQMTALAQAHNAINLAQGFPEEDTPAALKDLLKEAILQGKNQYAPMAGVLELRNEIAKKWQSEYNISLDPVTEIQITAGATQALFTCLQAFLHKDDEILVFAPAYDSFIPGIRLAGATETIIPSLAPDFAPNWEAFEAAITPKSKAVIINSPHNPSAKCFSLKDWQKLIAITEKQQLLLISDEVYEPLVFDGEKHISILNFEEVKHRSLAIFSFGKAFNITGWKIGYVAAAQELIQQIRKVHQFQIFSVHTPSQHALANFLKLGDFAPALRNDYQQKRDYFAKALTDIGFEVLPCAATYFLLANFRNLSDLSDTEFCAYLCAEIGVAAIPTSVFYQPNFDQKIIRFCFAKKQSTLEKAIEKLWTLSK